MGGHYYTHGIQYEDAPLINEIFLKVFGGFSKFAVNCFVLVTGYYGAKLTTKRIVPLIKDRWFYSVFLSIVLVAFGVCSITPKFALKTVFPLLLCRHNYITVFVVLYFFIPYINILLNNLSKDQFRNLLITETIFFSVIPTLFGQFSTNMYSYILWMMFLYQIGYYLQIHKPKVNFKIVCPLSIGFLLCCSLIIEPILGLVKLRFANTQNSIVLLIASGSFLGLFTTMKPHYNSVVNSLAKSTFAVYILHDDPDVRAVLWTKVLHCKCYINSSWLPVHFVVSITAIYIVCVAIDKIYQATLAKPMMNLANLSMNKTDNLQIIKKMCKPKDGE